MDKSFSCGHEKDDLISRRVAIDAVYKCTDYYVGNLPVMIDKADAYKALADLPAVDAVPVVRCGECKHLMADGRCFAFADDNIRPSVSDFCSYGERREEDETGN